MEILDSYSIKPGWHGSISFGRVSNDTIKWRNVGDEFPVHSVIASTEEGFIVEFVDGCDKLFSYFKFGAINIDKLSTEDSLYVKKVYY